MNPAHASRLTQLKVGFFALLGLILLGVASVAVSGRPMWWKSCQLVQISVDDATGLKSKAPVRSLGIQIGYLKSVSLSEEKVVLGICITAPVEVLSTTRAYLRGEGFLGDKFVELKPVKYLGAAPSAIHINFSIPIVIEGLHQVSWRLFNGIMTGITPSAYAEVNPTKKIPQEIPVGGESQDMQQVMRKVDEVLNQVSGLADNLKNAIDPDELKKMMKQINQTLQNAAKTLAPEGGLTQTAQRSLGKLEDAIEQLRDMMTRINRGEGSLGKLINDPVYAEEIHLAIKNVNRLLNRVSDVRFHLDLGGVMLSQYKSGRGWFQLGIWPQPDRYYLIGISADPRGSITNSTVTTTVGGITQVTQTQVVEPTKLLFTAMLGKVFYHRFDFSLGALYGDGAVSAQIFLGPVGSEDLFSFRTDIYVRNNSGSPMGERLSVQMRPFSNLYVRAGVESFQNYNGPGGTGGLPLFVGGGLSFDDEDIKLLFTFK